MQFYGSHFESAAMNGTCFQGPIGFIKFSISPEFVPRLMDQDLAPQDFCIITWAKSFQVNDVRENLSPHVENARRKPQTRHERLVT